MKYLDTINKRFITLITILMFSGSTFMYYITKYTISEILDKQLQNFELKHIGTTANSINQLFLDSILTAKHFSNRPTIQSFLNYEHLDRKFYPLIIQDELNYLKKRFHFDKVSMISLKNGIYYDNFGVLNSDLNLDILKKVEAFNIDVLNEKFKIDSSVEFDKKKVGLFSVEFKFDLIDKLFENIGFFKNAKIFLVDDKFNIRYSIDRESISKKLDNELINHFQEIKNNKKGFALHGNEYLFVSKVDSLNWHLIVDLNKDNLIGKFDSVFYSMKLFEILLVLIFVYIIYVIFTEKVNRPLKLISEALKNFNPNVGFDKNLYLGGVKEFEDIKLAFEHTSDMLVKSYAELRESKELLKDVVDAADDMIFFKDKDLIYQVCNREYARIYNQDGDSIVGKKNIDLFPERKAIRYTKQDINVLNGKIVEDYRWVDVNGEKRYFYVKKSPVKDSDGNIFGVVGVVRDITNQKEMQNTLKEFNMELEQKVQEKTSILAKTNSKLKESIEKIKDQNSELILSKNNLEVALSSKSIFISNVSHKLRTPLNSIINFTKQTLLDLEKVEDSSFKEDSNKHLNRVLKNSNLLLELINSILEYSDIELNRLNISMQEESLNRVLRDVFERGKSFAHNNEIDYKLYLLNQDIFVKINKEKFSQILLNIISNSFKFTKEGNISLRLFADSNYAIIEVEDSGIGIEKDKQSIVFEPFEQVDNFIQGQGLGLAIAKKLSTAMDIHISLFSQKGYGSTFRLKIKRI